VLVLYQVPTWTNMRSMGNLEKLLDGWCKNRYWHISGDKLDSLIQLIQGPQHRRYSEENRGELRDQILSLL